MVDFHRSTICSFVSALFEGDDRYYTGMEVKGEKVDELAFRYVELD